jgi:AraC family transcriptional regulator
VTSGLNAPEPRPRRLYGDELAANFGADAPAPFIVTRSLPHAELAVTEVRVDNPDGTFSDPLPQEDAYILAYELRGLRGLEYWENGRYRTTYDTRPGETSITDLRGEPMVRFETPAHCILWLVPSAVLDVLADNANVPRIDGLPAEPGVGYADETLMHLNQAAIAALQRPEQVNRLFVDHLTLAFAAHVAQAYGGMQTAARLTKGGLAPWQERRAKDMLASDLAGETPLSVIAAACGLSPDHFARAFRKSTGLAPHAWLLQARVDRATVLLRRHELSLSEIALTCGFVDQSHFTRVFVRRVGVTPGAWRRIVVR